jgi:anti-sigma factor ChrR (cupin superfamily)
MLMEAHDFLDEDLKNEAALYVLDAQKPAEARTYRLHLAHCDVCRCEVDSLAVAAGELAHLAPVKTPPENLWNRVLARVRRNDSRAQADRAQRDASSADARSTQIWKAWDGPANQTRPDFTFLAGDERGFEPTAIPGIEARKLFVDRQNDRVTMLVRMQAGTAYPAHVHADVEECYVIAGDLTVAGVQTLVAGDYQRAETGSTHSVQSTEKGSLLLLVSSLHDELV